MANINYCSLKNRFFSEFSLQSIKLNQNFVMPQSGQTDQFGKNLTKASFQWDIILFGFSF